MICDFCGESNASKRCSGCRCVHYCNETCQRAHWGVHKGPCKATKAAEDGRTGARAVEEPKPARAPAGDAARPSRALRARLAEYEDMSREHALPAVHIAAAKGDAEAVSALVALSRRNVHCRISDGDTPLHQTGTGSFPDHIGTEGHAVAASALLAAGAVVDALDNNGITPLACAAFEGATRVVRVLLAAGADPRLADRRGRTPYAKARDQGHAECMRLLKEAELARGAA